MDTKIEEKFNIFAYYISQYIWILYIAIPFIFAILFPKKTNKIILSSSLNSFNISTDPIIFAHVADTHINSYIPESIEIFRNTFKIIKQLSPEFVVLTGDIVDNFDSKSYPRYGDQNQENWKIYQEETSNLSNIPIIEVGGNHDLWGIKDVFSHKNYFLNYSHSFNRKNTLTYEQFLIHTFQVGSSNTSIITINPFEFPTAHPSLLLYKKFSKKLLNLFEEEISKLNNKCIVLCHYPIGSIRSQKSSSGMKFDEIIGSKNSINVFLSGHSHPQNKEVFHHGKGNLEILGVSSIKNLQFGLVSIDNNGVSWSSIDKKHPPKGVISYPIPVNQLSPNAIFNDIENSEIRVVIFSNQTNLSISFNIYEQNNIKSVHSGNLIYSRNLSNGHSLYTYSLKKCIKKHGIYKIVFFGDFDSKLDFVYDNIIEIGGEKLTEFPRIIDMLYYTFPLLILFLFIMTFILPVNCTKLHEIEEWIEFSKSNQEKKTQNWLIIIFLGFLIIRTRIKQIPMIFRIYIFIIIIYGLFGPILFFKTEDLIGYVFIYGYFINGHAFQADYGFLYSYIYLGIICTPIILLCSSFGVKRWSIYQIGDIIISIIFLVANIIILIRIVYQTSGPKLIATSISFIYIPILSIILLIIYTIISNKRSKINNNDGIVDLNDSFISSK